MLKLTLLFQEYCIRSSLYHVFLFRFTFFHLLPCVPICVVTWMKPPLSVNIAGILSPMAQQLPSVVVNLSNSASLPFLRLAPSKELMYNSKVILQDGPQVGRVVTRLPWLMGDDRSSKGNENKRILNDYMLKLKCHTFVVFV